MTAGNLMIKIKRFNSSLQPVQWDETYSVPAEKRITVLQALQYIYENLDPTLAFEYSCRYGKCGLCGVEVNGRPGLACTTYIKKDETVIAPLANLSPLRDLVIDRRPTEALLQEEEIFYKGSHSLERHGGLDLSELPFFPLLEIPASLEGLLMCVECLCCQASCPTLKKFNGDLRQFGGPFVFLKLAQLSLDPRDPVDRKAQALKLGIEQCLDCRRCYCTQGIALYKDAILPLLSK
jgi:succinate dehydrogenase / fumarate reductase, iron-sulfur subunit